MRYPPIELYSAEINRADGKVALSTMIFFLYIVLYLALVRCAILPFLLGSWSDQRLMEEADRPFSDGGWSYTGDSISLV